MNRFCMLLLVALSAIGFSSAFVPISRPVTPQTLVFAEEDEIGAPTKERGVSVDQDGKSNVWAIEPKMELSTKSDEEKTQSALVAGGGLLVFAVLAGVALSNLPDPNQF